MNTTAKFWGGLGFEEISTGGGCTAFERNFAGGRRIWLATNDASVPERMREPFSVIFERDADDGEAVVTFDVDGSQQAARIIRASSWWPDRAPLYGDREITTREHVAQWFRELLDAGINFHPDTRAEGYEPELPGGYDILMDRCFEVAAREPRFDVYQVALDEMRAWFERRAH